jgi:ABC-2 type transport system permease protein
MGKIWLVAKGEYLKRVAKRSFLLGTLLIPFVFIIIIGVTILIIDREKNTDPFGYVDHSGILEENIIPEFDNSRDKVEFREFPDIASARNALTREEIQAFQVLSEDFLESQETALYYLDEYPDWSVLVQFDDLIRTNILQNGPNILQNRIIEGVDLTLRSADGKRQFDEEVGFIAIIFPLIIAIFFIFSVMGASGYFLQAITDEKENRTMEIAITSVSPWQLISGKSIGLIGVTLSQITIWIASTVITWVAAQKVFPEIQGVRLPWDTLLLFAFFFIPSFGLIGGMMVAIGGSVTELQEGQQISGILNLLFTFPLFLSALAFADPNSPLLLFLSFWPTTSFLTLTLRWGLTIVPIWQVLTSWLILVLSSVAMIWIATRIFRVGMLRYGQKLSLKSIISLFRTSQTN